MELRIVQETGYVLAATSGPLDSSARDPFREYLHPLVEQSGTQVVLDLAGSKLITSHGIGQLVALVANANANSSRVILAACAPFVAIAINRCKLDRFFEMTDTVAAAVALVLQ